MAVGYSFINFVILIIVYLINIQMIRCLNFDRIRPDFEKRNDLPNPPTSFPIYTTTTTISPPEQLFYPTYDFIFSFSNVGLQSIREDFIINDKSISLKLDKNNISYISPYAFRQMRNLAYLDLSNNRIPTKDILSFNNVGLQTLIIDNNNPMYSVIIDNESVVDEPFERLNELHICNSQLKDFQIPFKKTPALTHLYLNNNSIESSNIVFDNIPNKLTHLFLDNNLIDRVEKYKLRYLTELHMDNNKITEVCFENCQEKSISLKDAKRIIQLTLSGNFISKISADAFKDTTRLNFLDLSKNYITEVSKGTFNQTRWMTYLSLADNKLTAVPTDICSLSYLKNLNLTGNQISTINDYTLCRFTHLEKLHLANNGINIIGSQTFIHLQSLIYLDLSGNQLLKLPPKWMYPGLQELHLEKNNFEKLDDVELFNIINLKNVYLYENPILNMRAESLKSLPTHMTVYIKKYEDNMHNVDDD